MEPESLDQVLNDLKKLLRSLLQNDGIDSLGNDKSEVIKILIELIGFYAAKKRQQENIAQLQKSLSAEIKEKTQCFAEALERIQ